jgi:hypothetical protein
MLDPIAPDRGVPYLDSLTMLAQPHAGCCAVAAGGKMACNALPDEFPLEIILIPDLQHTGIEWGGRSVETSQPVVASMPKSVASVPPACIRKYHKESKSPERAYGITVRKNERLSGQSIQPQASVMRRKIDLEAREILQSMRDTSKKMNHVL